MSINTKDRKLIKKYARLRGKNTPSLKIDILLGIYQKANIINRKFFKAEMLAYIKAVDDGDILAGQPITASTTPADSDETPPK